METSDNESVASLPTANESAKSVVLAALLPLCKGLGGEDDSATISPVLQKDHPVEPSPSLITPAHGDCQTGTTPDDDSQSITSTDVDSNNRSNDHPLACQLATTLFVLAVNTFKSSKLCCTANSFLAVVVQLRQPKVNTIFKSNRDSQWQNM
jgi:hypothetical protein